MVTTSYTTQATTPKSLSIAILIIFLVLLQPITFVLFRHGLRSWLAWLPLSSLSIVRIVGSAIQIHDDEKHTTSLAALILNSIGLAPLLLAALGVLHEARTARNPHLRRKLEWHIILHFHTIIVVSMILVIIGLVKLTGAHPKESDTTLPKVGVIIILVCWIVLVGFTVSSLRSSQYDMQAPAYHNGTKLLYGLIVALPFIGIRELDAVLSNFVTSHTFLSSLAVKVCLSVVPEMIATVCFVTAGLITRNIKREMEDQRKVESG